MPPWKPDPGFGDLAGERRLSDDAIATIDRWAKGGLVEGNPADLPPLPRFSAGWQLGEPDLVVPLPEYTLRADGADVFRNFVVTVPGTTTRYVRGFEFRPGSRAVHHANIRLDPTPASRRLDEADAAPGYEGMVLHSADYPDGHFLGWTPGQATPLASNDLAWRLAPGNDLVVQLHLQPTGKPEILKPSIGLYFSNEPPARTPAILRLGRQDINIEPGDAAYRIDRFVRAAGRRGAARHPAARALPRAPRQRVGDDSGRRAAAADPRQQLGLQLAGPVPLQRAVLGAGRDEARDGIRVRQLGREPAQPDASARTRRLGLAIVGRDGRCLDSGDDAQRRRPRAAGGRRPPQDGRPRTSSAARRWWRASPTTSICGTTPRASTSSSGRRRRR